MQKQVQYIIKGMNRDMSISKYPSDHSYENKNIRITQREDETLLSVTNEKGPSEVTLTQTISGTIIGHCAIREYLVLFVKQLVGGTSQYDIIQNTIYRITPETGAVVKLVESNDNYYIGGRNSFNKNSLLFGDSIQAFGVYESDDIIKVYWTDNKNQNRFVNIAQPKKGSDGTQPWYKPNDTNFVPLLSFADSDGQPTSITVEREDSSNGIFAPGAIQYMCTYYNMYGQESAFFYYSDLYYTSHSDRGGTEEESVSNSFRITITNPDDSFGYARVYSILRTSLNATPQCRIVADRAIAKGENIVIVDNGAIGSSFDYNALLFMCGDVFASRTMATKDETMFNGNLTLLVPNIPKELKTFFRKAFTADDPNVTSRVGISFVSDKPYSVGENNGSYPYKIHLDHKQSDITTFKYLETYRFGIQFLHKTGKWSDVIFIGDVTNDTKIETVYAKHVLTDGDTAARLVRAHLVMQLNQDAEEYLRWLSDNGFTKVRTVVVYPRLCDRNVLAQGIVCPTLYNVEDRNYNRPFAYSSWYARPNAPETVGATDKTKNTLGNPNGAYNEFRHNKQIPPQLAINSEIQCIVEWNQSPMVTSTNEQERNEWVSNHRENFFIDKSIVTFHSPELELSNDLDVIDLTNIDFRIIGIVPLTGFDSDIYLSTSTIGNLSLNQYLSDREDKEDIQNSLFGPGFYDQKTSVETLSKDGWRERMGNINWIDEETHYKTKNSHGDFGNEEHTGKPLRWYGFFIYPWHRSKSLNNTTKPDENGWESALLQNKIMTNCRYSYNSFYFNKVQSGGITQPYIWEPEYGVSGVKIANIEPQSEESEVSLIKIPEPKNSSLGNLNYYGTVDKIVTISNYSKKAEGYPIVISATSRLTGSNDESGSHQTRAVSFNEIYTGQYNQNAPQAYITDREDFAEQGTLIEYLPLGFTKNEAGVFNDDYYAEETLRKRFPSINGPYSNALENYVDNPERNGKSLRKTYWNVTAFDPVRIRFKSTKHAVMAFNYSSAHNQIILPTMPNIAATEEAYFSDKYFWEVERLTYATGIQQDTIPNTVFGSDRNDIGLTNGAQGPEYGYLYLGELYRKNVDNRFGGESEDALEKNTWLPGGAAKDIPNSIGTFALIADRGDAFYQRYDCIKTYPFTPDEKNSIIETVSFMCETRINIDGRYDKNRGNATKFTITPKNFNLMNPVYNQTNNFFNYQYYNSNRIYPNHFNQIAWSQTKSSMSEIDTWTKLNLGSLMDMDGDKGEIVALVNFGNEIWCFQERGVSKILFNNRVQIPVSDGVPIEITNGMKVQGKIYLTEKAGCQNKFAMAVTTYGVYFIDGYNSDICVFDGKSIQSLSDAKGFKQWISTQDGITEWKRSTYATKVDGFRVEYDTEHKDVYFINDDYCLVFSEILGEFTSFMDYNKVRGMGNVKDEFYSLTDFDGEVKVWKMFGGDYNVFFKPDDEEDWTPYYKPFYVQYNVNPDPTMDKTFDNVEFRSDSWFGDVLLTALDSAGGTKTFDTLEAENEYQYGALSLNFAHAQYSQDSTLKRKFRVWRTIMPREVGTRNRIRNTWCKVKLAWNNPNRYKTVLHDVIIRYFE